MSTCLICGCTDEKACEGGCSWWITPDIAGIDMGVCSRCKDFSKAEVLKKILACIDTWSDVKDELIKVDVLKESITELIKVI